MARWTGWMAFAALALGAVVASCAAASDPAGGEDSTAASEAASAAPALPLRASGRWVVDARSRRVTLAAVSWRGAEGSDYVVSGLDRRSLRDLVAQTRKSGFNAVRLAFSNELLLLGSLTTVDPARVARSPELRGKTGMEAFDAVVKAVTSAGLMVILENRGSDAGGGREANARWYTAEYPEEKWIADWQAMARRYAKNPLVVAADLRSELSAGKDGPTSWDAWAAAAERAGDAILEASPNLLVVVEGLDHARDLRDVRRRPVRLAQPGRLVYEVHAAAPAGPGVWGSPPSWTTPGPRLAEPVDRAARVADLVDRWGYLLADGNPDAAPVWVGELDAAGSGPASELLREYVAGAEVGWSYGPAETR